MRKKEKYSLCKVDKFIVSLMQCLLPRNCMKENFFCRLGKRHKADSFTPNRINL